MTGIICMWHGLIVDIPDGWLLCDGTLDTPDLRDRFVIGAPDGIDPGDIGGTTAHRHPVVGSTLEAGDVHTHSLEDIDTDTIVDDGDYNYEPVSGDYPLYENHIHQFSAETEQASETHTHTMNFQTQLVALRPPYYKILFIMKT